MSVKLIMKWDIQPGKDQDYFEFVVREWVPATTQMGLEPIGAWYSMYSADDEQPRMMAEALAEDLETMRGILRSTEWERLHDKLMNYVENYSHKVVLASGDFQL